MGKIVQLAGVLLVAVSGITYGVAGDSDTVALWCTLGTAAGVALLAWGMLRDKKTQR